jgi:dipeptidyl aminopeptidase/acylaminoacyl peptidase
MIARTEDRTMIRRIAPALLSLLILAPAVSADDTPEKRPMTVEDLWALARIGEPSLSPDGKWVAFPVTSYSMEENKGNSDLWLAPVAGGSPARQLTWNEGSDTNPVWSPDGKSLAFLSKRGEDGPAQLYLLPMDGGEAKPVTNLPVAVKDPKWFPDGHNLAFVAATWPDLNDDFDAVKKRLDERKEDKVKVHATESRLVRYWDHYLTDGRAHHIFRVDLRTGKISDLMPGSTLLLPFWSVAGSWDLSPEGAEIAFSANASEPPYRKLNFDLFVMSASGGEPENLTRDNPALDGGPRYSPDGRYLLYGRNRRPETSPDFTRLALRDRQTGETKGLVEDWDGDPGAWTFTPDGQTVVFLAEDHGKRNIYAVPTAGGTPRAVFRGGTASGVKAGSGGQLVFTSESITRPARLAAVGLDGNGFRSLALFNPGLLDELDLGTVEDTTFEGADGEPVQMFVVHPPGFDPEKEWPLLMLLHGGPHGSWLDSFHYRWNTALFASPGYVVAAVNFHGSSGAGQEFAESIMGAHGDKPFTDIMKATDALLARGYIDESRMAAAGGSYGGYLASWILGHTDRFAALIDHAGVYDLMGQFASDYTWSRANNYGAAPWQDPERIDLWSPSRYAKHFNTPTLVIHGEKDYRVPYTQGLNLYGVLSGKGVPARLVIFPDENHFILKPQNARRWWSEVFDWLDRYLGAKEETSVR